MSDQGSEYHQPVLLTSSIDWLITSPSGIYVDVTFGGGGHSREILKRLKDGKLIGFDQDADAEAESKKISDRSFTFCRANFRYLKQYLRINKVKQVEGVLGDLGISSHQIDTPERGFSTRFDHSLDMRMDVDGDTTAAEILNTYSEEELVKVFGMYGEVRNARTLAAEVVKVRFNNPIETIDELKSLLKRFARKGKENRYYAQVFQALRIEVNDEMSALEEFLNQCTEVIGPGGRLVIISYHSLEDRMVKNFMRAGNVQGKEEKDFYGNKIRPFKPLVSKPIVANDNEIEENNRARSARLRIAEKL